MKRIFFLLSLLLLLYSPLHAWCVEGKGTTCPPPNAVKEEKEKSDLEVDIPQQDTSEGDLEYDEEIDSLTKDKEHLMYEKQDEVANMIIGLTIPAYSYPNHVANRKTAVFSDQLIWFEYFFTHKYSMKYEYISQSFDGLTDTSISEYKHSHHVFLFLLTHHLIHLKAKVGVGLGSSNVKEEESPLAINSSINSTKVPQTYSTITLAYQLSLSKHYHYNLFDLMFGGSILTIDGKSGAFNLGSTNFGIDFGIYF